MERIIKAMEEKYKVPALELIMVDGNTDEVIGYVNFARFHLDGIHGQVNYSDYQCLR